MEPSVREPERGRRTEPSVREPERGRRTEPSVGEPERAFLYNEAALVVFAPTPHSAQLGKDIVLPCSFKVDGSSIDLQFLAILWLFKKNVVLRFDIKGTSSNPRMFINKQDISKGIANMEIKNVTISDIGQYRCMVIYSPQQEFKDIDLSVYATPSVTIESVEKEDKTSFALCSVTSFYPKDITVEILKDHTIIEDSVLSEYHTNADGSYSVNRTWTIPSDKSPKMLSCSVHHKSLTPYVQKDLKLVYQGDTDTIGVVVGCVVGVIILILAVVIILWIYKRKSDREFKVDDIESPVWIDGEKTTLSCKASNCTGDVKATWSIKFRDGSQIEVSDAGSGDKEEEQPLLSREYLVTNEWKSQNPQKPLTTKLTFIPSISRHLGSTVTCRISHKKKSVEKTCEIKSIHAKPKFVEPVQFTLSDQGDVLISVKLQRFYPKEMEVSWFSERGQSEEKIPSEVMISNSGDTFDLESKCTVSGELFKDPTYKVIVRWKHKSMEESQSRELSVRDLPWRPKLQNIPIESVFQDDEVVLQCRVSEYFPNALAVKWFEKKIGSQNLVEISNSQKYKIPEISLCKMENQTFSSTAILSYKRSDLSEKGIEFICRVEHPSLENPFQSSILQYRDTEVFIINNIQGPQTWYSGEKVTLYCADSYCLEDTRVIWMVKASGVTICETGEDGADVKIDSYQSSGFVAHRERTEASDKEGLHDVTSSLTFTPIISKHQNISVACKIVSDEKVKEKTFQPKNLYAKPSVSGPIKLSLTDSGEVLCSLDIDGFYPGDISIKWNDKDISDLNGTFQSSDGTYCVHSDYKLPESFFSNADSAVKVSWKHISMEDWERRQLSLRDKEFPWKANVKDITVPNLLIGGTATLKCEVSNVFPNVLDVKWLKKEKGSQKLSPVIHNQTYNILELQPEKQKDNTFTYKACLKFKPSIRAEEEAEIICRVEHPTLEGPTEKSTGPLTIKGIPKMKDIVCEGEDTYSLEVDGFYPKNITVSWTLCGQSSTVEIDSVISHLIYEANEDGSYRARSTCDLRKANNNLEKWTDLEVRVEHEMLDSAIVKRTDIKLGVPSPQENIQQGSRRQIPQDVSKTDSAVPREEERIIVGEIKGPCRWIHGEKVTLYCPVSYWSKDTRVMWMVEHTDGGVEEISNTGGDPMSDSSYMISKETEESDREGLFNITSLLTLVPSVSKHIGVFIACKIYSDGQTKTKKFQPKSIDAKPQVMEPVKTSLCDGGDVFCSLSLQNLYPKHLKVVWQSGNDQLNSKEDHKDNNDHTYNVQSSCTIPGYLLLNPNFTLRVTWSHKSLEKPQSQVLSWRDLGLSWRPGIEEVPILHILTERQNTLQYNISRYFPNAVTVSWYRKEKGGQEYIPLSDDKVYQIPEIQSKRQSDLTYSCTARLLIKPNVGDGESEIMCRVSHPSLERPIERRSGPLKVQAKPKTRKPIKASLGTGEVIFSYILENCYPKDIQMDWRYWLGEELAQPCPSKEKYTPNLHKTFTITSECRVPENLLHNPNFRVRVTWRHESMDEEEYKEFYIRDKDFPWRPQMEISVPPLRNGEEATIQCRVTKYFPEAVCVTWLRKDKQSVYSVSSDGMHRITNIPLDRQNDKPYGGISCVTFSPSLERDQGVEYICRVEHPSLEQPIEKSTGALHVVETQHPPPQYVSNITGYQHHPGVLAQEPHHPPPQDMPNMMDLQHRPGVPAHESQHPSPQDVSNMMDHQHHSGVPLPETQHLSPQDVQNVMRDQNHSDASVLEFHHSPPQDMSNIMSNQHDTGVPGTQSHHLPPQDVFNIKGQQHHPGVAMPESHHRSPQDVHNMMGDKNHPGVPGLESHHPPSQCMSNTMSYQHHPSVPGPEFQTESRHLPPQDVFNMSTQQ
ncbi:uncharacterized protein ACMZJ9_009971, partial [Mantella aurantiaca]